MDDLTIGLFRTEFERLTREWTWQIQGLVDTKDRFYPLDSDTKVLSSIFELLCSPVVRTIAKNSEYTVETANQTTYPDFTLSTPVDNILTNPANKIKRKKGDLRVAHNALHRIAIDIKTTYKSSKTRFTLGGYNSFIRSNNKNILYPYSSYQEHWIVGFIYTKTGSFVPYDLDSYPERADVKCPYSDVSYFIRPKHEISGLRAGSGNTKNIGSFVTDNPNDFKTKHGPFMRFTKSKEAFNHYWKNYEKFVPPEINGVYTKPIVSTEDDLIQNPEFKDFGPILEVADPAKQLPQTAFEVS